MLSQPPFFRARSETLEGGRPNKKAWQRPTLPPSSGSTIGAAGLNFRVRDGNGWYPCAIVTRQNTLASRECRGAPRQMSRQYRDRGERMRLMSSVRAVWRACSTLPPFRPFGAPTAVGLRADYRDLGERTSLMRTWRTMPSRALGVSNETPAALVRPEGRTLERSKIWSSLTVN